MERGSGYPGLMSAGQEREWATLSEMGTILVTKDHFCTYSVPVSFYVLSSEERPSPPLHRRSSGPHPRSCGEGCHLPVGKGRGVWPTAHRCPAQHFEQDYSLFVTGCRLHPARHRAEHLGKTPLTASANKPVTMHLDTRARI